MLQAGSENQEKRKTRTVNVLRGPITWYGLPDLRDHSYDGTVWRNLPVRVLHIAKIYQCIKPRVYQMISAGDITTMEYFGVKHIPLSELSQTARCQMMERIFRHGEELENLLYTARQVQEGLKIDKGTMHRMIDQGYIQQEVWANTAIRYPSWGMIDSAREMLREAYVLSGTFD